MLLNFFNSIVHVQKERCALRLDEQFKAAFGLAASVTGVAACCFCLLFCSCMLYLDRISQSDQTCFT
jgi:hypothetical protein